MDQETSKFEFLKLVYEKSSEQFRFYLLWRQLLFNAYFVILSALVVAGYTLYYNVNTNVKFLTYSIPVAILLISILFGLIDNRIKDLFESTLQTAKASEAELNKMLKIENENGLFTGLDATDSIATHTWLLRLLYFICGAVGAVMCFAVLQ